MSETDFAFKRPPHVLIVEARFYSEISDHLASGAVAELERAGAGFDRYEVPGALEIPAAIRIAHKGAADLARPYDAFVALGCVIRGETTHYEIVSNETARGLMILGVRKGLAIGNGVLTVENRDQALERARPEGKNWGAKAARAALSLYAMHEHFVYRN